MAISEAPISSTPIAASADSAFTGDIDLSSTMTLLGQHSIMPYVTLLDSSATMESQARVNVWLLLASGAAAESMLLKFPAEFTVGSSLSCASSADYDTARTFVSSLQASSTINAALAGNLSLSSAMKLASATNICHVLDLMSALELSGADDILHAKAIALFSALVLSSAASDNVGYLVDVAAAMVLRSLESYGWDFEAVDGLTLSSMFTKRYATLIEAVEQLNASASAAFSGTVHMAFVSTALLDAQSATQADLHLDLFDAAVGMAVFKLGDDVYHGIVLSTEAAAFTEYTEYPFNSLFTFKGKPYGVADDGIYLLEGSDDAGEPIEAAFKTKLTTMRQRALKDARGLYLGYTSDGELVLKVTTTRDGKKREDWYKAQYSGDADFRHNRMKIQRGLRSTYWQFEVANVDGADFEVEDVTILYEVLSRRIR